MNSVIQSISSVYLKIKASWRNFLSDIHNTPFEGDISKKYPFVSYLENNSTAYTIMELASYKLLYVSELFYDIYGISKEDYKKYGDGFVIGNFDSKHVNYHSITPKYAEEVWNSVPDSNKHYIKTTTVGVQYIHPKNGKRKLSVQGFELEADENKRPLTVLLLHQDVTHLIKSEHYWVRIFCDVEPKKVIAYHSEMGDILRGDILSTRESEILSLIKLGKTTEEISDTLFISKITVNNHRQNMLNKIGAKDTTALIIIAKMCNL